MESIDEIVRKAQFEDDDPWAPRAPSVNEFVNFALPGSATELGRVKEIGETGTLVEVWSKRARAFVSEEFLPREAARAILSRCAISRYSLTGEFEATATT